jgi:ABC-type nitrate/sulfonate/bicarbonate transport system ATPase subunit
MPTSLYLRTVFAALSTVGADLAFARDVADALQLNGPETRGKRFGELSKGWQLRHQWFQAVAKPTDLLLMDEPFDGLDDTIKPVAFDLLRRAVNRYRPGILLVSHHYHEIARVADRVFELADKTLRPRGTRPYDATVVADGRRDDYRGLTGQELLGTLAETLLASRVANVELKATATDARRQT